MNDGGPVTLVYGFLFCWFGALVTASSLAEMASMYETRPNNIRVKAKQVTGPLPPPDNTTGWQC